FLAVAAGLIAGLVMTVLQARFTVPLIVAAETYETAAPAHSHDAATPAHGHDDEAWAPADGFERMAFTTAANLVTAVGFALLLLAAAEFAAEFAGGIAGWRSGLFWGLAGFAVFTLAPGLGLPPELPAMPAAELLPRQIWWIGTVAAAAAGIALIFLGKSPALAGLGVALLVIPHLVGAPQPASFESPIPEGLHHRFVVAVTMTSLVFWALLGTLAGVLRPRVEAWLAAPRDRLV
ncbi:MAG TPA: CbtA family protein, partial [Amaricoccus sp.]|nr:CbtA family protein [Amaricoccus sp.]